MFDNLITGYPNNKVVAFFSWPRPRTAVRPLNTHNSKYLHLHTTNHSARKSSQVKESRAWHKCLTTKLQFNCPTNQRRKKQCLFFLWWSLSWLVEMTGNAGGRRIAKIKCDPNNLADRLVKRAVPTKRQKNTLENKK